MKSLSSKLRSEKTRLENKIMKDYLLRNDVNVKTVKHIKTGSMRNTIYLYAPGQEWTKDLRDKLTYLNFNDFEGKPLGLYSGNGKRFCLNVTFRKFDKCC